MTTPASPPLSLQDVAAELRNPAGASLSMLLFDCMHLAGVPRLSTTLSLSQLAGKTRVYWGDIRGEYSSVLTRYDASDRFHFGVMIPSVDTYFGNAEISGIYSQEVSKSETFSGLTFVSDPGFRNSIKARLLDLNYGLIREVTFNNVSGSGTIWETARSGAGDPTYLLLRDGSDYKLELIKL